jgi:exodeoxyribonuclease-3
MRIVAWNIRAGGGTRVDGIFAQLAAWQPDIVCLCEFRATPPSQQLAASLAEIGLDQQATTASPVHTGRNALLLASRWPIRPFTLRRRPTEPGRWLTAEIAAPLPFALAVMHVPNMVTGRKLQFMEAIRLIASKWRRGPAIFLGDTNCGWPGIDEETPVFGKETALWLDTLATLGWRDAYRYDHPEARAFTWYSPNAGNGFRLDQAFVNRRMIGRLTGVSYEWARPSPESRRDALSDHAGMLLDFE